MEEGDSARGGVVGERREGCLRMEEWVCGRRGRNKKRRKAVVRGRESETARDAEGRGTGPMYFWGVYLGSNVAMTGAKTAGHGRGDQ